MLFNCSHILPFTIVREPLAFYNPLQVFHINYLSRTSLEAHHNSI